MNKYSMRSAVCEPKFRGSSFSLQMDHEERITELQLLRVSNDAHRLTEMIDSLSKASNLDRRAKDVAKELLRSAVDLQESLTMLGKLQDASKQLAKTTKMNAAAGDGEREARRSVDGSSRDCIEELRRVISDSFQRHNLLTRSSEDERTLSSRSMRFNPEIELRDEYCELKGDAFASNKKVKTPNLIAKLMGLEEVPSDEMKLRLKPLRTPTFDIHMPNARKQQVMERSPDLQRKTLQDIIDKMQFKRIMKNGQAEDLRTEPLAPNSSPMEQHRSCHLGYDDEFPPIVIMKPLKPPNQERPDKEFHLQKNYVQKETETVAIGRMKIMEKPKVHYAKKFKALDSQQEQGKEEFKTRKKTVDRQKPLLTGRKSEEKEVKVRRSALSQEKTSNSKQSPMSDKNPSDGKSNLSSQACALQKHKSDKPMKESTKNSSSRKKKTAEAKSVKTSTTHAAIKDSTKSKDDGRVIKRLCETAAISTLVSSSLLATAETKQAEVNQAPSGKEEQKTVGEVLPKIISGERSLALEEEATQQYGNKPTVREELKAILLSSQTFLKDAQKFISPNGHQPIYRRKIIEAAGTRDAKLFLDCAIELMARKSHQKELASLSMFTAYAKAPVFYYSLDPLLLEISKAFEKITTYNAINADTTYEDSLYIRLEKDLKCKDILINSMWDVGWSYCVCTEEAEEVVHTVGEYILFWLIEEIAKEILLFSFRS